MSDVSIRDLRDKGGKVIDRAAAGEPIRITRDTEADVDPLPVDALIAATAISRGLPLCSVNPRDVAGIVGPDVVGLAHPG